MPELLTKHLREGKAELQVLQARESWAFWEMGRKRSSVVPVAKDVVGIIFPRSQKALDDFRKSPLVL